MIHILWCMWLFLLMSNDKYFRMHLMHVGCKIHREIKETLLDTNYMLFMQEFKSVLYEMVTTRGYEIYN